ncbi:hypothetical protein C8J57DRAFT_1538583 [Mycena rebaudengoi]|nr:hypothetical protein C8J57DRAFT_1538583 [Mycena rebaudengoi]
MSRLHSPPHFSNFKDLSSFCKAEPSRVSGTLLSKSISTSLSRIASSGITRFSAEQENDLGCPVLKLNCPSHCFLLADMFSKQFVPIARAVRKDDDLDSNEDRTMRVLLCADTPRFALNGGTSLEIRATRHCDVYLGDEEHATGGFPLGREGQWVLATVSFHRSESDANAIREYELFPLCLRVFDIAQEKVADDSSAISAVEDAQPAAGGGDATDASTISSDTAGKSMPDNR